MMYREKTKRQTRKENAVISWAVLSFMIFALGCDAASWWVLLALAANFGLSVLAVKKTVKDFAKFEEKDIID